MIVSFNLVPNTDTDINPISIPDCPCDDYNRAKSEPEPFLDLSLLDPIDGTQEEVRQAVFHTVVRGKENGLQEDDCTRFTSILTYLDIFLVFYSAALPARVRPLCIQLTDDAKSLCVRLHKYSYKQREFLRDMVSRLVHCGIIAPNAFSVRACAPLLTRKPGFARFPFTVDLRPASRCKVRHHMPMP